MLNLSDFVLFVLGFDRVKFELKLNDFIKKFGLGQNNN